MMKTLFKESYFKIAILGLITLFCFMDANSQNFAKDFLNKQKDSLRQDVVYLFINPSITYRNESIEKMPNFYELEEDVQAELLEKYAPLYSKIIDTTILREFSQNLSLTLSSLGFKVIEVKDIEELNRKNIDETHHTLNIAQMEVEEYSYTDSLVNYQNEKEVFYKQINGVRFNTWLIYNEADTNSRLVFYNDESVEDFFDGEIRLVGKDYIASYDYEKIKEQDAYSTAKLNAQSSSKYFFNFLMNKYVWIKSSGIDIYFYGIDLKDNKIQSNTEPFDNFDIVDYN